MSYHCWQLFVYMTPSGFAIAGNYLCIWPPVVLPLLATICVYDPQWFWCLAIAGNHLCIWPPVVLMFGHCWQLLCVFDPQWFWCFAIAGNYFLYMTSKWFWCFTDAGSLGVSLPVVCDALPLLAIALCMAHSGVLPFHHYWQRYLPVIEREKYFHLDCFVSPIYGNGQNPMSRIYCWSTFVAYK